MATGISLEVNEKSLAVLYKILGTKAILKNKTKVYVLAVDNLFSKAD